MFSVLTTSIARVSVDRKSHPHTISSVKIRDFGAPTKTDAVKRAKVKNLANIFASEMHKLPIFFAIYLRFVYWTTAPRTGRLRARFRQNVEWRVSATWFIRRFCRISDRSGSGMDEGAIILANQGQTGNSALACSVWWFRNDVERCERKAAIDVEMTILWLFMSYVQCIRMCAVVSKKKSWNTYSWKNQVFNAKCLFYIPIVHIRSCA